MDWNWYYLYVVTTGTYLYPVTVRKGEDHRAPIRADGTWHTDEAYTYAGTCTVTHQPGEFHRVALIGGPDFTDMPSPEAVQAACERHPAYFKPRRN